MAEPDAEVDPAPVSRKRSRALRILEVWSDLLIALGILVSIGTYFSLSEGGAGGLLLALVSALVDLGYLLGCATACTLWAARRHWQRASVSAVKAVAFVVLIGPCLRMGDYVHLALFYPAYVQQIRAQGANNLEPVRFNWGDKALWVTDGFQGETLVYDPTDALAATVDDIRSTDREGFGLATRHLIGHFYVELEFST